MLGDWGGMMELWALGGVWMAGCSLWVVGGWVVAANHGVGQYSAVRFRVVACVLHDITS